MLRTTAAMLCFLAASAIPTSRDAPARTDVKAPTEVKALNDQVADLLAKQLAARDAEAKKRDVPGAPPSRSPSVDNPDPAMLTWEVSAVQCVTFENGRLFTTGRRESKEAAEAYCREPAASSDCKVVKCFPYRVGYLHVPLSYDPTLPEYKLKLKLRVSMFEMCGTGKECHNLLTHCGGPGSDDSCGSRDDLPGSSYEDGSFKYQYNYFGIAQRGINGNQPDMSPWPTPQGDPDYPIKSHPVPMDTTNNPIVGYECDSAPPSPPLKHLSPDTKITEVLTCQCMLPEEGSDIEPDHDFFTDPADMTQVTKLFQFYGSVLRNCRKSPYWELKVPESNGKTMVRNALEYIGTGQLAHDMNRMREAIGAATLSCYGYSYGTAVCSSFAAAFPDKVGRWATNGNVDVGGLTEGYFESVAIAQTQHNSKLLRLCRTGYGPGTTCLGTLTRSPSEQFMDMMDLVKNNPDKFCLPIRDGSRKMCLHPGMFYGGLITTKTDKQVWFNIIDTVVTTERTIKSIYNGNATLLNSTLTGMCSDTWLYGWCSPAGYATSAITVTDAIRAADYTSRYGQEGAVQLVSGLLTKYTPAAVSWAIQKAGKLLVFPTEPTPNVYGYRSTVGGYVVGSLYDDATPYRNAKLMREGMSATSLVTWQGLGHCVGDATYDPEGVAACNRVVSTYWKDGTQPPDGYVCRNSVTITHDEAAAHEHHNAKLLKARKLMKSSTNSA